MLVGLVFGLARGQAEERTVLPLDAVLPALHAGKPQAVLDLGILALFATPLVGVATALAAFVRRHELQTAAIAAVLLILLSLGFAVALR